MAAVHRRPRGGACIAVESLPRDLALHAATWAGATSAPLPYVRVAPPVPPPTSVPVKERRRARRDTPVGVRLGLQQRAATNLHRHVFRAVRRFAVLVIADLASFGVMRLVVRAVRVDAVLGERIATDVHAAIPPGILNGWQYAVALFGGLLVTGNYARADRRRDARRLFLGCALATALPLWMTLCTPGLAPVLLQYGVTTVLVWLGLVAERKTIDRIVARVRAPWRNAAATLFVGPAEECRAAITSRGFAAGGEYRPIGFVDAHVSPANDALGQIDDFATLLQRSGAEAVVVCGYLPDVRFREVVDAALTAECQLLSIPRAIEIAGVQPNLMWQQGEPLIALTSPSLKGSQFGVKRVIDVLGSIIGLFVAWPVMIAIAIAIKLDSPGPIFFRQERVGLGGRRFRMLKFRTMRQGADAEKGSVAHLNHTGDPRLFKIPNDPRVTGLGRRLRRWSLDELPQLWNVLVGDMSLIGPRPFFEADLLAYEDHHFRRLGAKPGITGLWQVKGRSAVVDFEDVVRLDRKYIEDWSLWLDLRILAGTVPAVLRRTGAY